MDNDDEYRRVYRERYGHDPRPDLPALWTERVSEGPEKVLERQHAEANRAATAEREARRARRATLTA